MLLCRAGHTVRQINRCRAHGQPSHLLSHLVSLTHLQLYFLFHLVQITVQDIKFTVGQTSVLAKTWLPHISPNKTEHPNHNLFFISDLLKILELLLYVHEVGKLLLIKINS